MKIRVINGIIVKDKWGTPEEPGNDECQPSFSELTTANSRAATNDSNMMSNTNEENTKRKPEIKEIHLRRSRRLKSVTKHNNYSCLNCTINFSNSQELQNHQHFCRNNVVNQSSHKPSEHPLHKCDHCGNYSRV